MKRIAVFSVVGMLAGGALVGTALYAGGGSRSFQSMSSYQVTSWEHGFKTSRVVATHYKSPVMGLNIGFRFPLNPNDADRVEISDFFDAHDGWVYQNGGSPGAETFVKFKYVRTVEDQDKKIIEVLPELSRVITALGRGEVVKINNPHPAPTWPDAESPDQTQEFWRINNNLNVNGVPYKKVEVQPGKWQWAIDQKASEAMEREEQERFSLFQALGTRRLSKDEIQKAQDYGNDLNIESMVSYSAEKKSQELMNAWKDQAILQSRNAN